MLWILYNFCPILHKGVHHCRATPVFPTPYIKPVLRLVTRPRCLSLPPWCEVLLWSTNTESLVMLALLESPSKLSSGWLTTYPQTSYNELGITTMFYRWGNSGVRKLICPSSNGKWWTCSLIFSDFKATLFCFQYFSINWYNFNFFSWLSDF